jgi:phosphopentomutase
MRRRVVIVVLDGFGVGAMDDLAPDEPRGHTLLQIAQEAGPLELPNLCAMGLGNLTDVDSVPPAVSPSAAYGRSALAHPGADTYLGHQELMGGGLDQVELRLLSEVRDRVQAALEDAGHEVSDLTPGQSPLVVDGCVLVADNIEARPRLNINLTASLSDIAFDQLTEIGQIVRSVVSVPRVIVVGGRGYTLDDMRQHIVERTPGQIGVDTPGLGVYDEHYQVRHLGVELNLEHQLATRAGRAGLPVVLLGKAADVIHCEGAVANNVIPTADVLDEVAAHLARLDEGLVIANVQETDLAGHEQDAQRYADTLHLFDAGVPRLLGDLRSDDVLLITADHGNDPTIGSSQHTREYSPVLAAGPTITPVDLGIRSSLADIGATAAELLGVGPLGSGRPFTPEVLCSST